MPAERGMGRGLAAILSVVPGDLGDELRSVPVASVVPNPRQPRAKIDEGALRGLADSIASRGVLQPVLVRPAGDGYELIAGERRWRAAQMAGLEELPAIVRERGDAGTLELALIENMAREDLNPVDEARACAALVEELDLTQEQVGQRVGRGRVAVANLLRLLDLPDEALELIAAGELSEGHGRALLMARDHGERRSLARAAVREGWSVRELERRARGAVSAAPVRPRRGAAAADPDERAAADSITEALALALGADVKVSRRGDGWRAQVDFDSAEEALGLAERLGARTAD